MIWSCIICWDAVELDDLWHRHPTLARGICLRCFSRIVGDAKPTPARLLRQAELATGS